MQGYRVKKPNRSPVFRKETSTRPPWICPGSDRNKPFGSLPCTGSATTRRIMHHDRKNLPLDLL